MRDRFNRELTYLRISVVDRCNLRCLYCMPAHGAGFDRLPADVADKGAQHKALKAGGWAWGARGDNGRSGQPASESPKTNPTRPKRAGGRPEGRDLIMDFQIFTLSARRKDELNDATPFRVSHPRDRRPPRKP